MRFVSWTRFKRPGFKSDGCTLYRDHPQYRHCCVMHDWYYWNAGIHDLTRRQVDRIMYDCLRKSGEQGMMHARYMYFGARIAGWVLWYRNVRANRERRKEYERAKAGIEGGRS